MSLARLFASALFAVAVAVPAFAQEPTPAEPSGEVVTTTAAATPDGSGEAQLPRPGTLQLPPMSGQQ